MYVGYNIVEALLEVLGDHDELLQGQNAQGHSR